MPSGTLVAMGVFVAKDLSQVVAASTTKFALQPLHTGWGSRAKETYFVVKQDLKVQQTGPV